MSTGNQMTNILFANELQQNISSNYGLANYTQSPHTYGNTDVGYVIGKNIGDLIGTTSMEVAPLDRLATWIFNLLPQTLQDSYYFNQALDKLDVPRLQELYPQMSDRFDDTLSFMLRHQNSLFYHQVTDSEYEKIKALLKAGARPKSSVSPYFFVVKFDDERLDKLLRKYDIEPTDKLEYEKWSEQQALKPMKLIVNQALEFPNPDVALLKSLCSENAELNSMLKARLAETMLVYSTGSLLTGMCREDAAKYVGDLIDAGAEVNEKHYENRLYHLMARISQDEKLVETLHMKGINDVSPQNELDNVSSFLNIEKEEIFASKMSDSGSKIKISRG